MPKKMKPEEFEKQMKQIFESEENDTEEAHYKADGLMCNLLSSMGYGEGIKIFLNAGKWYA